MNNKNVLDTIFCIIALTAIVLAVFLVVERAMRKQEIIECIQLRKQAERYEGFFIAEWEREQCNHYQIIIK